MLPHLNALSLLQTTDFFVLRRPLLPVDKYMAVQHQLRRGVSLAAVMQNIYQNPLCQEAIYYASPPLHTELMRWLAGGDATEKFLTTLYKYFIRMATRSTPFGLFAGISVGYWSEKTDLLIDNSVIQRHVRLDTNYVSQLIVVINADPLVRMQLTYTINSTLWSIADMLRYVGFSERNGRRAYFQNETQTNAYLNRIIEKTQGYLSFQQLVDLLTETGIESDVATDYVHALIDNQLLISELGVNLTGQDPLTRLLERLRSLQGVDQLTDQIVQMQAWLQTETIPAYHALNTSLQSLIDTNDTNSIQCDTLFPADKITLDASIQAMLTNQLAALTKLSHKAGNPALDEFKQRFFARYENQTIPFLVALDPDMGIGYGHSHEMPSPWLDGLTWGHSDSAVKTQSTSADTLLRLYSEALRNRETAIQLTPDHLNELTADQPTVTLPVSAYVSGSLVYEADSSNPLFVLKAMGGPSAANLLGRFAHTTSDLTASLRRLLENEQEAYPDAVLAELVHLPESRTGNILRRPKLRSYEIPILTNSILSESNQLLLSDLYVSVPQGNRVVIQSKKLNQRVIPRLATAHHVQPGGLAHYRFLYDLQRQDDNLRVLWEWGILKKMTFLPRVQYLNTVLSRARWYFTQNDLTAAQPFDSAWKERYQIPHYVVLAEGDNELVINTDNSVDLLLLQQVFKKDKQLTLFEWIEETIPPLSQSVDGQRWCNELIIPLHILRHHSNTAPVKFVDSVTNVASVSRQFPPGSEWVYVKIYAGAAVTDWLLCELITPLLEQLGQKKLHQTWFFIRYADPEKHLRLRFRAKPGQKQVLLQEVSQWIDTLMSIDKRIHRVQFDTYEREIERFRPDTIEACERWFGQESQAVLNLLAMLAADPNEWQRLRIACLCVHSLLTAWQYDMPAQIATVEQWRDTFFREFQTDKIFQTSLNDLFREHRAFFTKPQAEHEPQLVALLSDYQQQAGGFYEWLSQLPSSSNAIASNELLPHLAHLLINRLFADSQRKNELIVYAFLYKLLRQWKATT